MAIKERLFTYSLILILSGVIIYFILLDDPDYVDEYNDKIEALEKKNDSILGVNEGLVLKVDSFNLQIDTLNTQIVDKDEEIYKLNKTTNEKVNRVDSYTVNELNNFFTDRYNDSKHKRQDSTRSN